MRRGFVKRGAVAAFLALLLVFGFLFVSRTTGQFNPPSCTSAQNTSLTGFVQMSNYTNVTGANVSVSNVTFAQTGPSTTFVTYNLTDTQGFFNITLPNGNCGVNYILTAVLRNTSNNNVSEVMPSLPPLPVPALSYLNGGTLYLQEGATLNLTAYNSTGNATSFNYIVFDESIGFPVAESISTLVNQSVIYL